MARFLLVLVALFSGAKVAATSPVYIGLDADMSAVAAEGGRAIKLGALLAIDEINQQGGVLGRELELMVRDHRGNPARGVANIKHFAGQQDLVAILGGVHTPVALHELPVIHEHKLLYLDPWAAGTAIVENGYQPNFVFRVSVRDEDAATVLARRAKAKGYQKIGLLLERTGWGRSNQMSMNQAAKELGLSIVATEWFNWREKALQSQVEQLLAAQADVIFLVANAPEGALAIKAMSSVEESKRKPILSHWGIAGGAFVKQAGLDALNTVQLEVLQTFSFLAPENQAHKQKLLTRYQELFDKNATAETLPSAVGVAHAYDLVHLLKLGIEQAQSIEPTKVRLALENLPEYKGLVKTYAPAFTRQKHDALNVDDYIMARFNQGGYLVPVTDR